MNNSPTLHMIGNAHIDPVWLWRAAEGRAEVLSTYRSTIELMQETDGFVFSSGGAITYRWVQEDDPALFEAIRRRVAEGRWEIVNGWMIQPDCNIPCGESFVRQGLYGQRAFQDMFGLRAVTGYNVDSFGHAGSLPQILRGCGLINYIFTRPAPGREKDLPGLLFWWESDDGSRVLAARPPTGYGSGPGDLTSLIEAAAAQIHPEVGHLLCLYGVGNHGGGPTRINLASIQAARQRPDGPRICFARTDRFFDQVRAAQTNLPVVHDELQHHARGCYTAVSAIKRANRRAEQALLTADKFSALALRYCNTEYPQSALNSAWEKVLFNQFHDILAGTSIRDACAESLDDYAQSQQTAQQVLHTALHALNARLNIHHSDRPLIVWNPHPWNVAAPVEATLPLTLRWHDDWRGKFLPAMVDLTDECGQTIPCQITQIEHDGGRYLLHLVFQAELPALGYRCYSLTIPPDAPTWQGFVPQEKLEIENEYLHLAFDPDTGWLASLWDKEHDLELLRRPGSRLLVIDDPSDTWSHDLVAFDHVIGEFRAHGQVALVESGPVRQRMRVTGQWGHSTVTLDYILYAQNRQIDLDLTIDWHEQLKMLKLALPLAVDEPQCTSSIPYGHIQRAAGGEEPCQDWIDLSGRVNDQVCGLALLNDGLYGYDTVESELRMSLLRSPVYAFHTPREIEPGVTYRYTDQGEQHIRLALLPHTGDWRHSDAPRRSAVLNAPSLVCETAAHAGDWPLIASFLSCDSPHVLLTALKKAEDGDDWIVRGYETSGQAAGVEIELGLEGQRHTIAWRPGEIKTLRLRPGAPPESVSMLEEPLI